MPLSRAQLALLAAVLAAAASSSPVAGYGQPKNGGLRAGGIRGLQKGKAEGNSGGGGGGAPPAPAPAPEPEPAMEVMEEQPMAPAEMEPAAGGASGAEKSNNGKKADEETPTASGNGGGGQGGGGQGGGGQGGGGQGGGKPDKDDKAPRGFKKGRTNDRNGNPPPKGFGDDIEQQTKKQEKAEQMKDKKGIGSSGKTLKEEAEDEINERDSMTQSMAPGLAKKADAGPPALTDMGAAFDDDDEGSTPEEDDATIEEEEAEWNNGQGKKMGGGGAVTEPEQDGEEKPAEEVIEAKPNADKRQNSEKVPKEPEPSPLPEGTVDPNADESAEEPAPPEKPKGPKEQPVNENRYEPAPSTGEGGAEGEDPSAGAGLVDDVGVGLETDGAEPSPEEAVDLVDPELQGFNEGLNDAAAVEEDPAEEEEAVWIGKGQGKGNANGATNGNNGGGNDAEEQA